MTLLQALLWTQIAVILAMAARYMLERWNAHRRLGREMSDDFIEFWDNKGRWMALGAVAGFVVGAIFATLVH